MRRRCQTLNPGARPASNRRLLRARRLRALRHLRDEVASACRNASPTPHMPSHELVASSAMRFAGSSLRPPASTISSFSAALRAADISLRPDFNPAPMLATMARSRGFNSTSSSPARTRPVAPPSSPVAPSVAGHRSRSLRLPQRLARLRKTASIHCVLMSSPGEVPSAVKPGRPSPCSNASDPPHRMSLDHAAPRKLEV